MSVPKSVTKLKKGKNGSTVYFESNVDRTQYYMFELARAALRDSAKVIVRLFREEYYKNFEKHTGNAGRATKYKVYSNKNTKKPRVEIGLKTGQVEGFYAYFQEFGAADGRIPKLGLLRKVAIDNFETVRAIQAQYLSGIEADNPVLDIPENDIEGGGDED